MKALIIGGDSMIGKRLAAYLGALSTTRRGIDGLFYDLGASRPNTLPEADVIYLVASMTRFRDCEISPDAYAVNVDAQVAIAAQHKKAHIIYISSEAAEWANQTAYGAQKRACELSLLSVCGYDRLCVVRPRKVLPEAVDSLVVYLANLGRDRSNGVHRWDWDQTQRFHASGKFSEALV